MSRYHATFFDRNGTPYVTVQNEDRDLAVTMMEGHIGKKKAQYVTEFRMTDECIVMIFKEVIQ